MFIGVNLQMHTLAALLCLCACALHPAVSADVTSAAADDVNSCTAAAEDEVELLKQTLEQVSRQAILQQLFVEERIRSDGDSGLKQVRDSHVRECNLLPGVDTSNLKT